MLLEDWFPRRPPRVALVDRPDILTWPHVEEDGVLCLLGGSAEVDHTRPAEVAQNLLAEASELIEDLIQLITPEPSKRFWIIFDAILAKAAPYAREEVRQRPRKHGK